jgi:hypothetical protein
MKVWTVHLRNAADPVLVREGFSLGAAVFGPVWLAAHRAWVPAAFALAAWLLIGVLADGTLGLILEIGLALLIGFSGHDLQRWSLARRGYVLAEVVTGRQVDGAFERLLLRRRDLRDRMLHAGVV